MDVSEFIDFLEVARQKDTEEKLYQEWLALYPLMITKTLKFMSFSDYCDRAQGKHIDRRPADVIIAEIESAHSKIRKEETNGHI